MSRRARRERETLDFLQAARRFIRAAGERVADADEFELAELVALRADLEDAIRRAVMNDHTEHMNVEAYSMECVEGECEHIGPDGDPYDLSACPSFRMEVCVDCMVARGHDRDAKWWEGEFDEWPHPPIPEPVEPEPAIFRAPTPIQPDGAA